MWWLLLLWLLQHKQQPKVSGHPGFDGRPFRGGPPRARIGAFKRTATIDHRGPKDEHRSLYGGAAAQWAKSTGPANVGPGLTEAQQAQMRSGHQQQVDVHAAVDAQAQQAKQAAQQQGPWGTPEAQPQSTQDDMEQAYEDAYADMYGDGGDEDDAVVPGQGAGHWERARAGEAPDLPNGMVWVAD